MRGQQLLARAQVLIYDALVDFQLLSLVPSDCLKLYVGKRGGKKSTPQTEINQLLVTHCLQGKQVVRLKSGDPLHYFSCVSLLVCKFFARNRSAIVGGTPPTRLI